MNLEKDSRKTAGGKKEEAAWLFFDTRKGNGGRGRDRGGMERERRRELPRNEPPLSYI